VSAAGDAGAWLLLYAAARLTATAIAMALVLWSGLRELDALLLLYGPLSTAVLVAFPSIRRNPAAWIIDCAVTLVFVLQSGDWRSPFYLLWLASLALPATSLPLRRAFWLASASSITYLVVAIVGGPVPGRLQLVSTETLAIHVSLPFMLVVSLAYAAEAMRRLASEHSARARLAIEAERKRIAWELHDSAKQRLHAAHLLVTSLQGRVPDALAPTVARASIELESAASDMDTSLAELRSPLEGRRLDEAVRARAAEIAPDGRPRITVRGEAPELPPLVGAHAYRIASEALTNALRHADASEIDVAFVHHGGHLCVSVRDDGRGLPAQTRTGGSGLMAMENRAATIGARLTVAERDGAGTVIELDIPLDYNGG
jgi:signal transduction histidine kinase